MSILADALTQAVRLHQAGDLPQAEAIYRQILEADPAQADALHCLGVIAYQVGRFDAAIDLMKRSVALAPLNDGYLGNLGLAYQAGGRLEEAVVSLRESVRLRPQSAEAHNNLGNALVNQGHLSEGVACYEQALRLRPDYADPFNNLAVVFQRQGKMVEAEACCRQALRLKPANAEANHNLATALLLQGKSAEAADYFRQSLAMKPDYAEAQSSYATALQRLGQLEQATTHAQKALALRPDLAAVHNNLGSIYQERGQLEQARECFQQALQRDPCQPDFSMNLGIVHRLQGQLDEALALLRQTLALRPEMAEAHYQLAIVLQERGTIEEAIQSFQHALKLRPDLGDAGNRLGVLLGKQGRLEESALRLKQSLRWHPDNFEYHNNLGNTLNKQGKFEEAIASLHQAILLQPHCVEAHHNLGIVYSDQGDQEEATRHFEHALRLKPDKADSHAALGDTLHIQGRVTEAVACLEEALRLRPSDPLRIALATCLPVVCQSTEELEHWRKRLGNEVRRLHDRKVMVDVTDDMAKPVFYLAYHGFHDRELQRAVAALYRAPSLKASSVVAAKPAGKKIRIGFISCFFRKHTIGHWMHGLVAQLARDAFEVVVFSIGSHDDDIAVCFKQHADHYVEVPRHLPTARKYIAEQGLDILFYTDIGMDPMTYTLAMSRLAPVQCVTMGHPITTGIGTMDYYISTEALEPEGAEEHYTETLIRLQTMPFYYYRPPVPSRLQARDHFGLAEGAHVYACLQTLYKFHPRFDEMLGAVLRNDPQGILILSEGRFPHLRRYLQERLARTLPDVVERIRFFPLLEHADYLNLLALADVQLDPMPFGGGSTSYDGMSVGTPIVTLPSRLLRGRITLALYQQMNVLDCVAKSPQDYLELALRLGNDRAYRDAIRSKIIAAHDVLFENSAGIRELEQFFHQAVDESRKSKT